MGERNLKMRNEIATVVYDLVLQIFDSRGPVERSVLRAKICLRRIDSKLVLPGVNCKHACLQDEISADGLHDR